MAVDNDDWRHPAATADRAFGVRNVSTGEIGQENE